jgi:tetratricopeptide (TPR) repeat protein
MSASDGLPPRAPANRHRRSITIRREDHIGDAVGLAFLEAPEGGGDAILARLGEYLGARIKILKAEVSRDEINVEVELRGWPEEGARLAAAADDLYHKGARRNAAALFREAIELDPLNPDALLGIGLALAANGRHGDALDALRRAREIVGDTVPLLLAMARAAIDLEREPAAVSYLYAALRIEPKNFIARRALKQLGHEPGNPGSADTVRTRPR